MWVFHFWSSGRGGHHILSHSLHQTLAYVSCLACGQLGNYSRDCLGVIWSSKCGQYLLLPRLGLLEYVIIVEKFAIGPLSVPNVGPSCSWLSKVGPLGCGSSEVVPWALQVVV